VADDVDGIQTGTTLQRFRDARDAVLFGHGGAGELRLGTTVLDATTMAGVHAEQLRAIGTSLTEAGDILLYGCNFAEGQTGEAAAQLLADLTGADIAASDDTTGHVTLGGDWALERQTGAIEATTLDAGDAWRGQLAVTVLESNGGNGFGGVDAEDFGDGRILAQTFNHSVLNPLALTYDVGSIELALRIESSAPSQMITMSIRESLNGPNLASVALNSSALSTNYEYVTFNLLGALTLNTSTDYFIVLESNSSSKEAEWATRDNNSYGRGEFYADGSRESDVDAFFRVNSPDTAATNSDPVITSGGGGETANFGGPENSTFVTTVTATDADAGDTVTYAITGGADAFFRVNSPDTAATNSDPVITSGGGGETANFGGPENSTFVTTVTATDADAGDTVTYAITGGADAALLEIDANTGELSFINAPDFENPGGPTPDNAYEVIIEARDGNGGTDTQTLNLFAQDVNEAPTATAPPTEQTTEDTDAFAQVTMSDPDAGDTVTASIGTPPSNGTVTITPSTGTYRYTPNEHYNGPDSFTVIVTDSAGLTDEVT
ncbi:MAG: DUF4347 domain-containing protein, partial [Pseudomonadota bacterium]